jgi:pyruvate formate lyase activating enzyme
MIRILGLMQPANILHPEIFHFDVDSLADEFYKHFLGIPFQARRNKRSIVHPAASMAKDFSDGISASVL